MNSLIIITICLFGITLGQENKIEITTCYYCDTTKNLTAQCRDPYDTAKLDVEEALCVDLEGGGTRSGKQSVIQRAFQFERKDERSFKCIKVTIKDKNGESSFHRTCGTVTPTVTSACEYLKAEVDNISECHECDSANKCNGAVINTLSLGLGALALILFKIR